MGSEPRTKTVWYTDPQTLERRKAAVLRLTEDGRCEVEWHDESLRREAEEIGWPVGDGGTLRFLKPSDGQPFFDRVEREFAASSFVSVEIE